METTLGGSAVVTLPGTPAVAVAYDVPCTMRDGVVLRSDVYRPADGSPGPWPVLLMRLPYDKTQAENVAYAHPSWYAQRGYLVVIQDCRGRWRSDGEWSPFRDEADDGYDTIAWASTLPGSSGKVGMYGFSYAGATQLLAATRQPPALAAICPAMSASQYHDGWTYSGGALNLAFVATWATDLAAGDARKRGDAAEVSRLGAALIAAGSWLGGIPLVDALPVEPARTPYVYDWLDHPDEDDYWRRWSIEADFSRIDVPALHVAGWYDVFATGSLRNFGGMQRGGGPAAVGKQELVVGPWHHMPWLSLDTVGHEPADHTVVDRWQLAFFDRHLKGAGGAGDGNRVRVWLMGEGRWRGFADWPPPGSESTRWFLGSAGSANSVVGDGRLTTEAPDAEPPDRFTYDPLSPIPSFGGQSCCYPGLSPMGPADQAGAECWNGVLVYTSPPLERELILAGNASLVLYAATSAVDTDWTARLCRVDANGRSTNLRAGIVRARFRENLSSSSLVTPNEVYRYEIDLGPVGACLQPGERIRLNVSSSDVPHWDRNFNHGGDNARATVADAVVATQTVLHDRDHPSCLVLPVLGDGA
jgi:hypothetical protein